MAHPGGRPRKAIILKDAPIKPYYTVEDVAAMTGLHIHTIQARLRDGTIKGKKLGGIWKIYPDFLINTKVGLDLNIQKEGEKQ